MGSNSVFALLFVVTLRFHCGFGRERKTDLSFCFWGALLFPCLMMGLVISQRAITEEGHAVVWGKCMKKLHAPLLRPKLQQQVLGVYFLIFPPLNT